MNSERWKSSNRFPWCRQVDQRPRVPFGLVAARARTLALQAVAPALLSGRLAEHKLKTLPRAFWSLTEQEALAYRASPFNKAVPYFE
jgi:hypothetical protein